MKLNAISLNAEISVNAAGVETISIDHGTCLPANPFVGLRPFESDESFLFFGRDKQILTLLQQLQSKHFLAVVGSSGCGKSSLIRAGLIPKLKAGFLIERRDHWRIAIMKPGESPLTNLSKTLLELASKPSGSDDIAAFTGQLRVAGAQAAIEILIEPLKHADANVLLVVDQFEELFRYDQPAAKVVREGEDGPSIEISNEEALRAENANRELRRDEAANFVSTILELASQRELPIYVVMTMRSDFLGDCDTFHGLPEVINETFYLVPRLTRQQRMEVIEKPIRLYGQNITSRLLDLVTNDVGDESDQLPVMQHALMRTWEKWKQNQTDHKSIDLPDYEAAEMISGALSKDAEIALSELADDERTIAKRMFQALVETDAQGRNVRRPARLTQLAGIADVTPGKVLGVIDHFRRDGRCFLTLTSERVEDDPLVDISHESLIRQWEELGKWVRSENYSKDQYTRVAAAALRHSVGKGSLLMGTDLQLAVDWWGNRKPNEAWSLRYNRDFHKAEKFLAESKAKSDEERAECERQRLRELEAERVQRQNKKLRRMMYALGVISLFALLMLGGAGYSAAVARRNVIEAEKSRDKASKQSEFALLESARASREANIAQDLAGRADRARYQAEEQAKIAARETARANRALELLETANHRNQQELIRRRRELVDDLGTRYQRALSLAASPKTTEEAVLAYEEILRIYQSEKARGGTLSTLLVLGRLFDGSLREKDTQRALGYYERSLPLFRVEDNAAEREKKTASLIKMGELLLEEKRVEEARDRFEEGISLGYQPTADERESVYRKLADIYAASPDVQNLEKARRYNELELINLDGKINSGTSNPIGNKLTTLIKLGTINMRLGKEREAKEKYEQAIDVATGPLDLESFEALARIGESLDRPEEKQARGHYFNKAAESVNDAPPDVKADMFKRVGDAYNRVKEYEPALKCLKQAEILYGKQNSKMASTYRSIGTSYERLGDKENALEYYRRAQTLFQSLRQLSAATVLGSRIKALENK